MARSVAFSSLVRVNCCCKATACLFLFHSGKLVLFQQPGMQAGDRGDGITLTFKPCYKGSYAEGSADSQDHADAIHISGIWFYGE